MADTTTRNIFNNYDKDKSGCISSDEFKNLVYDLGFYLSDNDLQDAIKKLDKNNDKKINFDEFSSWWQSDDRFKKLHGKGDKVESWSKYFKEFDKNQSGVLEGDEIKQLHLVLRVPLVQLLSLQLLSSLAVLIQPRCLLLQLTVTQHTPQHHLFPLRHLAVPG
jgi:calmodulin